MVASEFVKARLPLELKHRVKTVSERQLLSESAWIRRLIARELRAVEGADEETVASGSAAAAARPNLRTQGAATCRIYVRLRNEDWLLLAARATARGMRPATYVSVLTRGHLRRLAPLPKDELTTLKRTIGELAAIGRNLNQIARAANEGGRPPGLAREEFRAMLKVCEALRDNTKALLKENLTSWASGFGENV